MNSIVDLFLSRYFTSYTKEVALNRGEINVKHLRVNVDALSPFVRGLPVEITEATVGLVHVTGPTMFPLIRDLWKAVRNNAVDLRLSVTISDITGDSRVLDITILYTGGWMCPYPHAAGPVCA